jgi:methionyl-tRNA formyltransferase
MRIIFIGCTDIGFNCLEKLLKMRENIVAIYTSRKSIKISYSPTPFFVSNYCNFESLSLKYDIPIVNVNERMIRYKNSINSFRPDFILVVGWYYMIPREILNIPSLGCVGIHAGMLPKYRGNAPLSWAIINGEKETGASLFYFDEGIDNGDIIDQQKIKISERDTIKTLYRKVNKASIDLIVKNIPLIKEGKAKRIEQDNSKATQFPPRLPDDGIIDWNKSEKEIYNWVRAQTKPYPGAFFIKNSKKIIVWSTKISKTRNHKFLGYSPGSILDGSPGLSKNLIISCGDGYALVTEYEVK